MKYHYRSDVRGSSHHHQVIASILIGITAFLMSTFFALGSTPSTANAVTGSDFRAGRIIDDAIFYNDLSMDTAAVQSFLTSKVPVCDTNGQQPASDFGRPDLTRAQYAALVGWQAPPYTCLRDYAQNTPQMEAASGLCEMIPAGTQQTGAKIINDIAKACNINPQVLLVLLQKEQSLILDTWPLDSQYRNATGFACPDTAPCDPNYNGFFYQVYYAARQFQIYKNFPNSYNYIAGRNNNIYFNPDLTRCGSSSVYIENQATAALYIYTPYQPNQAALDNLYGTGDSCSAYGNRNFWRLFNDWFGSTYGYIHKGVNYADVFDATYYLGRYPDVQAAYGDSPSLAFNHFITYGMTEKRQGSADFDLVSYRNRHQDLRLMFGVDYPAYYRHYISNGKSEGRISTGDFVIKYIISYGGINYESVYNFESYIQNYPDIQQMFNNDDAGAIKHFVNQGLDEGRIAASDFNVINYQGFYTDLRRIFYDDLEKYYLHYITRGKLEGRIATTSFVNGVTSSGTINYAKVYSFNDYSTKNSDIRNIYGFNDIGALKHFIDFGMAEARVASSEFNVLIYKDRYVDLRSAFGDNLKLYYMHYISNGKAEGRTAI